MSTAGINNCRASGRAHAGLLTSSCMTLHELLCRQQQSHGIWENVRAETWAAAAQRAAHVPQQRSLCLEQHDASACCDTRCVDAGINNCTASGKTCGPTHGQLQDGQSYLCVSFDPQNLDAVAEV